MLAGSLSDLQRMMDRLTMVSVNYNMKINTKKTNVLRVSKGSESAIKIVFAGEIIEQVKEFCYLGSIISDDATEKSREGSQQRRQSGLKSGGSWIRVKKFRFLQTNFRKISIFFQAILQKNIEFSRQISENFYFFWQLKKLIFQAKKVQIIQFLFKSNHFRTYMYFMYMIRYNNISRPVHDPNDPPYDPHTTPCPKYWGR